MLIDRVYANDVRGAAAANWLPTQFGKNVLWLRADVGVTRVPAQVPAMTTWALTNLTRATGIDDPDGGLNAVRFTDTVDGAPVNHVTSSGNIGQTGPDFVEFWIRRFGNRFNFAAIQPSSSVITYLDLTTGAFAGGTTPVARIVDSKPSGYWKVHVENNGAANVPNLTVFASNGVGSVSYTGFGDYGFDLYQPVLVQDLVSQWLDQSGFAENATQGTAANQQLARCFDSVGNWVPFNSRGSGLCDVGWPVETASKNMLFATLHTYFSGLNKPYTIVELRKVTSVPATSPAGGLRFQGATADMQLLNNRNANDYIANCVADGPAAAKFILKGPLNAPNWTSLSLVFDGANGIVRVDNVASAATDLTGTYTLTGSNFTAFNAVRREMAVFAGALSTSDLLRVTNGMRARWGVALL